MSREQARDEGVDERTDIWSLGVVLYEMITGHLPFRGDYEQAVIYSILNEKPRPIHEVRDGVPRDVDEIVLRCLEKDPASRDQTLEELTAALRRSLNRLTGAGRAAPRRRALSIGVPAAVVAVIGLFLAYNILSVDEAGGDVNIPIAVADFENETGEESLDGLSGMLITALEQSRRLSVVTRARMFDILKTLERERPERIDESTGQDICRAAGIDALVIPSIRKFGDLYTIDLKVLDTRNNRYVYTGKQEGEGQESIPRMIDRIAHNIRVDLAEPPEEMGTATSVAQVTTHDLDAYQAYFEGEEHIGHLDFKSASQAFKRAVEIDSSFALAHYRLAYLAWWSRMVGEEAREHIAKAMRDIERVPEKERYLVRALAANLEGGFESQLPFLRDMQKRYPNDKEMLFGIGDIAFHQDELDTARVYFERVIEIDPNFERALQHLAWTLLAEHDYEAAREISEDWVNRSGSGESYHSLARAQYRLGDHEGALATADLAMEKDPDAPTSRAWIAEVYLNQGSYDKALALLQAEAGHESPVRRWTAGGTLASAVYPHAGRFRDAIAVIDSGLTWMGGAEGDSSTMAVSRVGKAFLYYWGWQDVERMLEVAENTFDLPDKAKLYGYWQSLAAVYYVAGDTARGNEIMRTKVEKMPDNERIVMKVLALSNGGECDAASALLESERATIEDVRPGALQQVKFFVGLCQWRNGDYAGAIENLEPAAHPDVIRLDGLSMIVPACHMLGVAYEEEGRVADAVECYERVLDYWKKADSDLPVLLDAKERLARLKATGAM